MKPGTANDENLTIGQMARQLGRSEWGVRKAIARMKIPHAAETGGQKLYRGTATLGRLKVEMRAPNQQPA